MDHRFSALFFAPPLPSSASTSSNINATMSGALPDPQTTGGKGKGKSTSMKHMLKKLFGIPRQTNDPLIKTAEATPSELSQQVWSEFALVTKTTSKSTSLPSKSSKSKKKNENKDSTIVVLPPQQMQVRKRDIFHKSTERTSSLSSKNTTSSSARDSKFSSISSLPSLASLSLLPNPIHTSPNSTINLSISDLALLQSLIRRIARHLKKQEYLTNHLAGNLIHLFARKEAGILGLKRVRVAERDVAAREVFRVKEGIGRGFLRRGVLVGRSEETLNLLRTAVDDAARAPSTIQSTTRRSSSSSPTTKSRSSSPESSTTTTRSSSPTSNPTFPLSLTALHDTVSTLTSSVQMQTLLNTELTNTIHTTCACSRWNGAPGGGFGNVKGNVNDRITMRRFVSFVDERVRLIEETGMRLSGLVGRVEGFGRGVN